MSKLTKQQRKWQAEEDAYTLARAEEIKASASRTRAAKREAKAMVNAEQKRLTGLQKVAGTPVANSGARRGATMGLSTKATTRRR